MKVFDVVICLFRHRSLGRHATFFPLSGALRLKIGQVGD